MNEVSFYHLNVDQEDQRSLLACRLAGRAYTLAKTAFILSVNTQIAADIDRTLWGFPPKRFIPHALITDELDDNVLVNIGANIPLRATGYLLINTTNSIPALCTGFERMFDLVLNSQRDAAAHRSARFKEDGYRVQTHEIRI